MGGVPVAIASALDSRYALQREIGRGGMATVYLAEDRKHRRHVAVKVLHPELGTAVSVDRFLQEIEIVSGLTHPHILPLFDSGEAERHLYYVMPFVEGGSLRASANELLEATRGYIHWSYANIGARPGVDPLSQVDECISAGSSTTPSSRDGTRCSTTSAATPASPP